MTTRELKVGMAKMSEAEPLDSDFKFTTKDINTLLRFMDPNADGDLSLEEVQAAAAKLEQTELESKVNDIFQRLLAHMTEQKLSLKEFFARLDESGDGSIDIAELRLGLERIKKMRVAETSIGGTFLIVPTETCERDHCCSSA